MREFRINTSYSQIMKSTAEPEGAENEVENSEPQEVGGHGNRLCRIGCKTETRNCTEYKPV